MIRIITTDGMERLLNVDMIKSIERGPRATIHLVNGETLHIKSSDKDVMEKIQAFRNGIGKTLKPEKNEKEKKDKKEKRKPDNSKK